jgi:hypothetical protein
MKINALGEAPVKLAHSRSTRHRQKLEPISANFWLELHVKWL